MSSSETEQGRECEKEIMASAGRRSTALSILASSCSEPSQNRQSAHVHINSVVTLPMDIGCPPHQHSHSIL